MTESMKEIVARAKAYPFAREPGSYLLVNGVAVPMVEFDPVSRFATVVGASGEESAATYLSARGIDSAVLWDWRRPVLALGSNASTHQLARKYAAHEAHVVLPVVRAELADFSVVYSAHFATYGSMPATLQHTPGSGVEVFVTYLNDVELDVMHRSEGLGRTYCFARLRELRITLEGGRRLSEAAAYLSLHGCLYTAGSHVDLAAVPARSRHHPAMHQEEILATALGLLGDGTDLEQFIFENASDPRIRVERIRRMKRFAQPFRYEKIELVNDAPDWW